MAKHACTGALLVVAMCAVPVVAEAGKARRARDPDVVIDVELDERTRPLVARTDLPGAPTVTADQILAGQGKAAPIRAEQIVELQHLIDETPDQMADEKADLYARLAELHRHQNRYWRLEAARLEIEADGAGKPARTKLRARAAAAAKTAAKALVAAVEAYQTLTAGDLFDSYPSMDRALFRFGYLLQLGGRMTEARKVYQRLIKEHPTSPHIPGARLAFGDYWFEMADTDPDRRGGHLENAAAEYQAVLELPAHDASAYARYKLGWVELNRGEHAAALAHFHGVVTATRGDKKAAALARAAKKDLVRAYAEVGDVAKARRYFQKVDQALAFDLLRLLGDRYLEAGKGEQAIYNRRELIGLDGAHRDVCVWQYDVAHAMLTVGKHADKVAEIERLVALYEALAAREQLPAEALAECHDAAAAMSGDLARAYHREGSRTLDDDTLGHAARLYRAYLRAFPEAADHGDNEYYVAELLWARAERERKPRRAAERWREAADAFEQVVRHREVGAAMLEESAYAEVIARDTALAVDPRTVDLPKPTADEAPAPRPLPDGERALLAAIDRYLAIEAPRAGAVVDLTFVAANVYRRFDHLDEAVAVLAELVEHHRDAAIAEVAVDVLLHSLDRLGRHDEMIRWVTVLRADQAFLADKDALAERLDRLAHLAERKAAERCEVAAAASRDDRRFVACGEQYAAIFNRDPDADDASEVLYNVGVNFERGKSIGAAIDIFETLVASYPRSAEAARGLVRLGHAYARLAWYEQAADKLEAYARTHGGAADAADAMNDAVLYRKGTGDDARAIADTHDFIEAFTAGKPAAAADAFFSLTSIYEKQGDRDALIEHLRRYLDRHGAGGGVARRIIAQVKLGEALWAQACKVATVDGTCVKITRTRATRLTGRRQRAGLRTRCGSETKIAARLVGRDARLVKQARKAFAAAIAAYDKVGGKTGGDDAAARYAYASARFHLAEADHEAFLAIAFPGDLDFDPASPTKARKSMKRFDAWVASKTAAAARARRGYEALIFEVKEPSHAIAAAARIGQLLQHFSASLFTAPVPAELRRSAAPEASIDLYCDTLVDLADPLELEAVAAFTACLETSTRLSWSSAWSRLCERELGQLRPDQYPTAAELRAVADAVAPVTSLEPVPRL